MENAVFGSTSPGFETNQYPVIQDQSSRINVVQRRSTALERRVAFYPFIMGAWIFDHHDFSCLLPISSAAVELRDFYEQVVVYAALTGESPSNRFSLSMGEIKLEIIGAVGTIVPWVTVQNFANRMIEMTKRGYINTYQINFIHRATGTLVTFNLYVGYIRALQE